MKNSNRVIHFEIQADDMERARNFYKDVFGWKTDLMMKKGVDGGMMDYWSVVTGKDSEPGINGGMYERSDDKRINTFECTIDVSDIDEAIKMIKANGGTISTEKMKIEKVGWFANAVDTEGNMFGVMQAITD